MQHRTRRSRALAAVLMVGASVAVFNSSVSPVAGDGPVQQVEDIGVLRLRLSGTGGSVTFTPAAATEPAATQTITATSKCGASTSGPLVTITSVGGSQGLGLVTNGLGVRQKNTCSSAEGRVSGSERLSVALSASFAGDVFVADAELDVEGKFNGSLNVSLDGAPAINRTLRSASDNGPDSGVGDNDRVLLLEDDPDAEPFRALSLSANGGEVSLEGGGDGSYAQYAGAGKVGPIGTALGTADTIFRLIRVNEFADDLFCEETRNAAVIGGSATSAVVTRLPNDGGQACEDVGVTFEIDDEGVLLDKGTTGINSSDPQAVNALVEIVWAPQDAAVPLPNREINFHPDEDPDDFETVQWCVSWDPVAQTAVHPPDARFPGGVLPWCLVDEHVQLQSNNQVVQTQLYHGDGDPRWQ
jgi:hypothetical protein